MILTIKCFKYASHVEKDISVSIVPPVKGEKNSSLHIMSKNFLRI